MWRQDTISVASTAAAVMISVYVATFDLGLVTLMPAILLLSGVALQHLAIGRREPADEILTERGLNTVMYAALAVAGISLGGLLGSKLPLATGLSAFDAAMFGVLMAVAEEQFFRGFITQWLVAQTTPAMGVLSGAAVFAVYHLAVYGTEPGSLVYVLIAGAILGWVCLQTGRLSPAILAHCINNLISVMP